MQPDVLEMKATLLLNARMRVSSSASMRDKTLDRIVEQILCTNADKGLTLHDVIKSGKVSAEMRLLRSEDVRTSLVRLERSGRASSKIVNKETRYFPTLDVAQECERMRNEDKRRFEVVARELFIDANGDYEVYKTLFFNALCRIFSRLTSAYAVISAKEPATSDKHLSTLITSACQNVLAKQSGVIAETFSKAIFRFFDERSPTFDALKWILAQNYYCMRLLGVDAQAKQLAAEMLKGSTLYLDTNILIVVLMPEHSSYADILDVLKCCADIEVRLVVSDVTLREFVTSVNKNAELLNEVYQYIPRETRNRVQSYILEEYIAVARREEGLSLNDFMEKYKDPVRALCGKLKYATVETADEWFEKECEAEETKELDVLVASKFKEMRSYSKTPAASLHDALMLRWVEKLQRTTGKKHLFLTRDQTLVAADKASPCTKVRTVSLDVLLQWIAPYCTSDEQVDHFAGIYAAALRSQLLPQEQIFKLQDFEVFRAMEVETDSLPAEAVEECLLRIKEMVPGMDLRRSEDREKISYEIHKYFVDPASFAATKISELNHAVAESAAAKSAAEFKLRESEAQRIAEKNAKESSDRDRHHLIEELAKLQKDKVDSRRMIAFVIAIAVFLVCCFVLGLIVNKYAEGANLFRKLTASWAWFVICPVLSLFAFRVHVCGSLSAAFSKAVEDD